MTSKHQLPADVMEELTQHIDEIKKNWAGGHQADAYFAKKALHEQLRALTKEKVFEHLGFHIVNDHQHWNRMTQKSGSQRALYLWKIDEEWQDKLSANDNKVIEETFGSQDTVLHWPALSLYESLKLIRRGVLVPCDAPEMTPAKRAGHYDTNGDGEGTGKKRAKMTPTVSAETKSARKARAERLTETPALASPSPRPSVLEESSNGQHQSKPRNGASPRDTIVIRSHGPSPPHPRQAGSQMIRSSASELQSKVPATSKAPHVPVLRSDPSDVPSSQTSSTDQKIMSLRNQISMMTQRGKDGSNETETLKRKNRDLESRCDELDMENSRLKKQVQAMKVEMELEQRSRQQQIADYNIDVTEINNTIQTLEASGKEMQNEIERLRQENQILQGQNDKFESSLDDLLKYVSLAIFNEAGYA